MKPINITSIITTLLLAASITFGRTYPVDAIYASAERTAQINANVSYPIVDTNQNTFYNDSQQINQPAVGSSFFGQDAHYTGNQPDYTDNGDGTITDNVTGLMWSRDLPDAKYIQSVCQTYADTCTLAGYTDWRLPTIKELYSLILFTGQTMMSGDQSVPYIDTDVFDFRWGNDVDADARFIDSQYATSTIYTGTTMNGSTTMFGVNFADGRIKGYGIDHPKTFEVRVVRGNPDYGNNQFVDNGNGTVTDLATGLMWQQSDDGFTRDWSEALIYAQALELAGHSDWRLPNAKELQSIVDYTRSPEASDPAQRSAAIDPVFDVSVEQSWYWSSTTHLDGPTAGWAVYVCFGQAFGYMTDPFGTVNYWDVHGAGAQRSDPKSGDPADWAGGHGPQGDEVRIYNYVRCVRDADVSTTTPVEMGLFEGSSSGDGTVELRWSTYSESNNYGFEIERSVNGADWQVMGFVTGAGTRSGQSEYTWSDDVAGLGVAEVQYRLRQIDHDGASTVSDAITVSLAVAGAYELSNNYPNPFNPATTINVALPVSGHITLTVYNVLGEEVSVLADAPFTAGSHRFTWQPNNLAGGVYFYTLRAGTFSETKKMVLLE